MTVAFFNVTLRGSALVARFLLLFFLGAFLKPEELGLYGLLLSYITYCIYALGFEFYNYSTREIISHEPSDWAWILKGQLVFTLLIYVIALPILCLIFVFHFLPLEILFWFYTLLILEHISHEINRILVAMSRPLIATVVLFLRSGAWAIIVPLLMIYSPLYRNLDTVFFFWLIGLFISVAVGAFVIFLSIRNGVHKIFDKTWVLQGIQIAIPFLIASLALRGLFSLDKILVGSVVGLNTLGAYTLFSGVSSAVVAFIDAGIIVFYYPKIVSSVKDNLIFKKNMRMLLFRVCALSLAFSLLGIVIAYLSLPFLGKALYRSNFYILIWQMASIVTYCFGLVPQLGLYGLRKDKSILYSHLFAFLVFVIFAFLFKKSLGIYAILIGQLCGFLAMLGWKAIAYIKYRDDNLAV